jgi:phosphate transport system permease protein
MSEKASVSGVPAPPRSRGDRIFSAAARGSGVFILALLAGVATFLVVKAWPAFTAPGAEIEGGEGLIPYLWPLVFGTVYSAAMALVLAVPLAVGVALFIVYYAPPRLADLLGRVVDLLAAIPSLVFGLWGIATFGPATVPIQTWLDENLGWLPFFEGPPSATGRTMFTVALVLTVMILPIVSALAREVFLQTPRKLEEAAFGLGATRSEVIRIAVLPYSRSAIVSASLLGLGRALGETMAVTLILSVSGGVTLNVISSANPSTIAANIALRFPESSGLNVSVLFASGLALFAITLVVNMLGHRLLRRHRQRHHLTLSLHRRAG